MVKFSFSNSKMKHLARHMGIGLKQVVSFDLPAGFTCRMANICRTYANKETGKITRVGAIMCYAAKTEAYAPSARRLRWHNFDTLLPLTVAGMVAELTESLPEKVKAVRIHSSGDFYSPDYFQAWNQVAASLPGVSFFGYTKELQYVKANKADNFHLVYSFGSKDDSLWTPDVPTCFIGERENQYPGYKVVCANHEGGHEDYYSVIAGESFVIPIH